MLLRTITIFSIASSAFNWRVSVSGTDENLDRQRARLARHAAAKICVARWGITSATVERYGLGLKAPYRPRGDAPVVENALSYPIVGADGRRVSRFAFLNLDGVTVAPPHPVSWGTGSPLSYWSDVASPALPLIVAPDVRTTWLLSQLLENDSALDAVVLTRSHGREVPLEWLDPRFWAGWPVVAVLACVSIDDLLGNEVARLAGREVRRLEAPEESTWLDALASGMSAADVRARLAAAPMWRACEPSEPAPEAEGDFAFDPVNIANAFVDGQLFYPFLVEERRRQSATGKAGERETLVAGYAVRVLRSDGSVLRVCTLPAPKGVSDGCRVYALSDGTRVYGEPVVSRYASWSFASITRYVRIRGSSQGTLHRSIALLASDVEAYLRDCVWLPSPDDYAVAVAYVLLSYVFPAFDAIPLLLVNGPKGTGKTELGQAIADLSCNGVVVGQASAAGLVRLMHEARGLIVLDDLERIGASAGSAFSEIAQMLKLSYKRSTATKPVADRAGSVTILDFFGPKCITNTLGADDVLGSRLVRIDTAAMPDGADVDCLPGPDGARAMRLRDELHCWGMARAVDVASSYRTHNFRRGRREEIEGPLRAIGGQIGKTFVIRLAAALDRTASSGIELQPAERLRRAIVASGVVRFATIQQLQLEMALGDAGSDPVSPETIGRLLATSGYRSAGGEAVRVRLNGTLCRVVTLDGPAAPVGTAAPGPLDFCRTATCGACRYFSVCSATLPAFHAGKRPK